MDSIPDWAAVNESVQMAGNRYGKKTAGLVNALLRRFSREGIPEIHSTDPAEKLSIEKSCPTWIAQKWIKQYGKETAEAILNSCNNKHPISIRTNTIKIDPESLLYELSNEDFEIVKIPDMDGYFNVPKGNGLFNTRSYKQGFFTVQDPEAALAIHLLSPEQGEMILDLCSAPGGKTTHIAEIAKDNIRIDAVDINPKRLGLVKMAAKRLGLKSINCIEGDSATFVIDSNSYYDRILCDVPCTGTGVFSKRPDMKWRRQKSDLIHLSSLQKGILGNAASLVKSGGVIIYSTCSLEPEENEDVIRWFTSEYDFTIEKDDRFNKFETDYGYLILPHVMNGNGAFAAKLRRI
jgi:16S rRNA (cytosine967-C5)-methyltransferase